MSNQSETSAPGSLRTGTKVALIVAAGFLATAVYFFMTPTHFVGKDGGLFGCGSPMSPNDSQLAKTQCGMLETVSRDRAILFLALALLTALLGYLLFGTDAKRAPREPRARLEDEQHDEDDDLDASSRDEARGSGRRARFGGSSETDDEHRSAGRRVRVDADDEDDERVVKRASVGRPRLGDEDEPVARKVRTRLSDDDEPRERRRSGRYDGEAFDSVRD